MEQTKTLYVGLDISLNNFSACYIDIESNIYSKKNNIFDNTPKGVDYFISDITNIALTKHFTKLCIGYEATNNYGFHLPFYLSNDQRLKQFNLSIYQINPKVIKNFRKSFTELPKIDAKDSYLIAERLKVGKLSPYTKYDPHYLALRTLTRTRFNLIMKLASEKSRFISNLYNQKFKESLKHKHKRAILFVARKLVRIVFSLLKNNKLYETPQYLKNQSKVISIMPKA